MIRGDEGMGEAKHGFNCSEAGLINSIFTSRHIPKDQGEEAVCCDTFITCLNEQIGVKRVTESESP